MIDKIIVSPIKSKKYRAVLSNGKKIDFGSSAHQHYRDTTPLKAYKHLDHNDLNRRSLYYARHKKDYPPFSADWFSKRYLWT